MNGHRRERKDLEEQKFLKKNEWRKAHNSNMDVSVNS